MSEDNNPLRNMAESIYEAHIAPLRKELEDVTKQRVLVPVGYGNYSCTFHGP